MKSKGIVMLTSLALVAGLGWYFSNNPTVNDAAVTKLSPEEQAMLEHCKMMPEMPGCEPYKDLIGSNSESFSRDINGLPSEKEMTVAHLEDGENFELTAEIIKKDINGEIVRAFGYNGSVPGPTLRVKQYSEVSINFTNNIDMETTVHWHGLRLDNRFDGVPGVTQDPVEPNESFQYTLSFPDPGVYWYHPHVREDYQQELGLYGAIIVDPADENYFAPVHTEEVVFLDDVLINDDDIEAFSQDFVDHALMGRFGNTFLINGESTVSYQAQLGEIRRFYFVNAANARPFRIKIPDAQMRLVGSDAGGQENEEIIESVTLSPSDRAIVDVLFDTSGDIEIIHETPDETTRIGAINVNGEGADLESLNFVSARENAAVQEEIRDVLAASSEEAQHTLRLSVEMDHAMEGMDMHAHQNDGIEWEDDMPAMNKGMTDQNTTWQLIDDGTGKINDDIDWKWEAGDVVKIRVVNDADSAHPMQHPIHLHGQRFVIAEIDGVEQRNLAWEDTVMIPTGATYDLVVEVTNPGDWMLHCHIPEHMHSGMMTNIEVK